MSEQFEVLNDESLMPYGEHKGKKMKDVPAKYLVWCKESDRCSRSVRAYINDNLVVIYKEAGLKPPGITTIDSEYKRRHSS